MADRAGRRSFAATVLLGLGSAALTAAACTRTWAAASPGSPAVGPTSAGEVRGSVAAPLCLALALVLLAAWGVVLVVRCRARRVVALLGAVGAVAAAAAALAALGRLDRLAAEGLGGTGDAATTAWPFVAAAAALTAGACFVQAWRAAPGWPEMGSRYDAPGDRTPDTSAPADLWRALDEGRDPTV